MKRNLFSEGNLTHVDRPNDLLKRLRARSPAGFAIAMHIEFTTPRYLFQAYDKDWLDHYSANSLVMKDPTVGWAFSHNGAIRWSALAEADTAGVLASAAEHGLRYGVAIALDDGGSKTMASFARADREMSDIDIAGLSADLRALHMHTLGMKVLAPEIHATLKRLSIFLTHG
mgnify:CR=1 FL=1